VTTVAVDTRGEERGQQALLERRTASIPWISVGCSLVSLLAFLVLLQTFQARGRALGVGEGGDWGLQATSALAPLAAIPLVLTPLAARTPPERATRALVSTGLLTVYAIALAAIQAPRFAGFMLLVALVPAGLLLIDASRDRSGRRALAAPLIAGWGPRLFVAGVVAYAIAVVDVLAVVPIAGGLLGILVGAPWAAASASLHPSATVRRALVSASLAATAFLLVVTAWFAWCLAIPLVYLAMGPAALALFVGAWPPWTRARGQAGVWRWLRWGSLALAAGVVVLAAAPAAGVGVAWLCG
jgi:hypothetical protein